MEPYILIAIISYLIGSISFGVILSKKYAGFDVREKGSKGAGTTNILRTAGKKLAAITLICDVLKGVVSILISMLIGLIWKDSNFILLQYLAGVSAIIGHTFPIFFGFRGGKGVATAIGTMLMLKWEIGLICLIFGIILIIITKMVSVGSVLAAILYPILTIFMAKNADFTCILISILIALIVIYNHRENLKRIKNGTENKLGEKVE